MQINSEANNLDLYSDARWWCGIDYATDTTSFPFKDFVRSANFGLDKVISIILRADGRWQFDDANNTSTELFDVTTNIVSGTKKYAIALTWLKIKRVRIKDSAGNWITIKPKDRKEWSDSQLTATNGLPSEYDLLGNWLYLDKAPDYSSTGGLEIQYQRGASYFATTDTTKAPGFATQFHRLISLYGALDYCEVNDLDSRAAKIRLKIGSAPSDRDPGSGMERELAEFYSMRNPDDRPSISIQKEDYGQSALGMGGNSNPFGF